MFGTFAIANGGEIVPETAFPATNPMPMVSYATETGKYYSLVIAAEAANPQPVWWLVINIMGG